MGLFDFFKKVEPLEEDTRLHGLEAAEERATPALSQQTGADYIDPVTGMEFVFVRGGCYEMGDTLGDNDPPPRTQKNTIFKALHMRSKKLYDNEKPVHQVCVDDFYMGKYLVTQQQWQKVMGSNPSKFKNGANYPVERVSWSDAGGYIDRLNQQTGGGYRLPTEAEWEYACREGGRNVRFGTGTDTITTDIANYDARAKYKQPYSDAGDYRGQTTPVDSFKPNSLGLYDMCGNVCQWVEDRYSAEAYKHHAQSNPVYTQWAAYRVVRGGSWYGGPRRVRCTNRFRYSPGVRYADLGFRLVADAKVAITQR
ncbi:sulfatase-modifying factor protein [Candidatus Magnetobacterium bavaricum]|uniref:Sulfatase-modifying factor protein n=1 Tax=Candidatus Magnetobacterium bavaricum TaxID=29290 RepID=A0A0F3GT98_9BACT|nr:sulfatase-modifying factor protein [Candidatus Magnetobacterium bavaricum]